MGGWLSAFAFTQAVEVPLYVIALRRSALRDRSWLVHAAIGFGASAVTHPIVWFVIPGLPASSFAERVARAEVFAVVVEGLYLFAWKAYDLRRALLISLGINAASASSGLLAARLFGWF